MKKLKLLAPIGLSIILLTLLVGMFSLNSSPSYAAASISPTPSAKIASTDQPSISNIVGASYDEARGEIVIFGIDDPNLPPLDFDYIQQNLVLALRSYYAPGAFDMPGVSIEGTLDPLDVIYFGGINNTRFGQVAFESDRLLKIFTLGKDNITGNPVTSSVEGYKSYPERMAEETETGNDPILIRHFFTPTLTLEEIDSPHTIIFGQTQKFVDWAYMSQETSIATTNAAQGFVDNFNQYYLDYAAERYSQLTPDSTLYEMIQLSKITTIAQWARGEELEFKLPGINNPWLSDYSIDTNSTVDQTPGITVTWMQDVSGTTYEFSLRGGVYAIGDIIETAPTVEGQAIADDVQNANTPPQPPPMITNVRANQSCPFGDSNSATEEWNWITCSGTPVTTGPLIAYVIPLADSAVANGDFEGGNIDWIEDSPFPIIRTESPHNGMYGVKFPSDNNANDSLHQTLYIPDDANMARITYWRAAATNETTYPNDFFSSYLADQNGNQLKLLENLDDSDADGFWREVSFDISGYIGQDVQLWFTATTDATNFTQFFLDDVSLDYLDPTPPTVTQVNAPTIVEENATITVEIIFHERMNTAVTPSATLNLQATAPYTLTPKSGAKYTNGYLNNDTTRWYGTFQFTTEMPTGEYTVAVATAQDLAGNVMYPKANVYTIKVSENLFYIYLPTVIKP